MTKILVIDDHPIVLQGCRRVLEDAGIVDIVARIQFDRGLPRIPNRQAGCDHHRSGDQERYSCRACPSSVGFGFTTSTRPILVLTMHEDPMIASQSLRLGANGYILKDTSSVDIIKALQAVRQGKAFLSHVIASAIAVMETKGRTNPLNGMTLRELQTLELIAQGKQYAAIAEELHVSYKTIANTCSQIKTKLGVKSLPELMRIAIDHLPEMSGQRLNDRTTRSCEDRERLVAEIAVTWQSQFGRSVSLLQSINQTGDAVACAQFSIGVFYTARRSRLRGREL